jgi:hypothetical protein
VQWTDKYSCQDQFDGSNYSGTGVVKGEWFIPSTQEQKTKSNDNNIVDSIFGILSNSRNSDNTQDLIEASNNLTEKVSVRFKNMQLEVQSLTKHIDNLKKSLVNYKKNESWWQLRHTKSINEAKKLQKRLSDLQNIISEKNKSIDNKYLEFNRLKNQKNQGAEYLFFAALLSIVGIVLITRSHRISIDNTKDRLKMIDSLASKDAKKEIELAKDKIVKKANDKVYKQTVKLAELSQSKVRLDSIEEVKNKIKSEYEKSVDREKLKQDAFAKITNEILENVSEAEREEIKTNAMNDLVQEAREELIAKHSEEVNSNLNVDKIKKEVEKDIKDEHFIEVMDEVREEYKKTVFNNLSDEEIEGLKKEVYLEVKQGFSSKLKGSTASNKKNTSSTLDDFIDSL